MAQPLEDETTNNKRSREEMINRMVPGHRSLCKQAGITKAQVKIGRTKDHRLTPEQEHKERTEGVPGNRKNKFKKLELNEEKMKELVDWMWKTRRYKPGEEDKKWAPAAEIPKQFRPKLNQILQYDWQNMNPYPGWRLAVEQGCSGWKCKLMNEEEFSEFEKDEKKRNPKSQRRVDAVTAAVAKRKEKAVSSSSTNKEQKDEIEKETEESSVTTTSDAEGPCELSEDVKKKCLEELLLPMDELDNIMLSLWLEIGEFSATHTCDVNFLGITATITAEIPRAVVPLRVEEKYTDKKPSVFVLTSTNGKTKLQWEATCRNIEKIGLEVVPVLGMDGEEINCMKTQAWRRAQMAWALKGFPYILKCINRTASCSEKRDWFIIAEDSAKLFPQANIEEIQLRLRKLPLGVEILQTGYRRCAEKKKSMKLLDLSTMLYKKEEHECKITKIIGQKFFIATRIGIQLLHQRLLKGQQTYFDTSMCELIRANVAIRDLRTLAGSRKHYSLVDGGKWQEEEMPIKRTVTITDLQAEVLP